MTGIMKTAIPGYEAMDVSAALAATARLGLDGCLFSHILDLSPDCDRDTLRAVRAEADGLGVRLAAGIGWINPFHLDRAWQVAAVGGGDFAAGFARAIEGAADIGLTDLYFMISLIEDRFDAALPWQRQLDESTRFLETLAPALRANGVRLLLKTHEEITTFEMVRVIEAVGDDVIGVALDPVNVLVRIEDPVAATRRVAPYVRQVHLDDAMVRFIDGGIRRVLFPYRHGLIDWPAILALTGDAPCFIEMHRGLFSMPVFDAAWLRQQPDLALPEFAAVLRMAAAAGATPDEWDQASPLARLPDTLKALVA